eukprot:scaffold2112_cov376-Prasinococcus_capsulatus_cf.AAC.4
MPIMSTLWKSARYKLSLRTFFQLIYSASSSSSSYMQAVDAGGVPTVLQHVPALLRPCPVDLPSISGPSPACFRCYYLSLSPQ